jgi:FtsP/CotA-like multicopper oxidase with cupredoxin domain
MFRFGLYLAITLCGFACGMRAQSQPAATCWRGMISGAVPEPADLRSKNGTLRVELFYRKSIDAQGLTRYCYIDAAGHQSPTLRVQPGDQVTLTLRNELPSVTGTMHTMPTHAQSSRDCTGGSMTAASTNLHFHGLSIPPVCHQDETLKTLVQPGSAPFEYSFRIPADQPPGLYWYHPHVHGFNKQHILGGASGALIVEGIENVNREVSDLPERVLVIRDQELLHPDAAPEKTDSMPPPQVLRDAEGDILNSGTGGGKPAKDLSINFVPVPYPKYEPAVITMRPQERQLWRVLNASSITYLDLQVLFNDWAQSLGVVALDGVPINFNGNSAQSVVWKKHLLIPPAGRVEFIMKGPKAGVRASLVTRTVDSGPMGENDPTRPLATILTAEDAAEPQSQLALAPVQLNEPHISPLRDVVPAHTRKLYFSETAQDPKNPNSPTVFYVTVDGENPMPFDPGAPLPNIVVKQGDVEDWIIENRTRELHDFHIHQIHFQLLQWNGVPVDEPYLRDTVNVAYWDGTSPVYPNVKLRLDFRSPNIIGTFLYHCHLLEHEDGGMMGTVRVDPPQSAGTSPEPGTGSGSQAPVFHTTQ